ncbi:MAG: hypothetical protein WC333_00325 [Dehalococcoidia bacterium]|jgi:hypothetical protein
MKIKRRFPNFFEGFEETEHEVNTREELLNLDWVKNYEKIVGHMGLFYSPGSTFVDGAPDFLMSLVRQNDGKVIYFVVGYIYGSGKDLGLEDYINFIDKD